MILILGGTGTLGHALTDILVNTAMHDVYIVSRCELRQKQMAERYPSVKFIVGDIQNTDWAYQLPEIPDYVFNLAAMKHVDMAEHNVEQCFKVNTLGTITSHKWATDNGVKYYIFSSTDKAVLPINAYGNSKALAEKYLYSMAGKGPVTSCYRWGNVLGSRGSVFHSFAKTLKEERRVYITHEEMTRFWTTITKVAQFMWEHCEVESPQDEPHIPDMKAASIVRLANATAKVLGISEYETVITGIRPGEKIHETLYSSHEYCIRSDTAPQFSTAELEDLAARVLNGE